MKSLKFTMKDLYKGLGLLSFSILMTFNVHAQQGICIGDSISLNLQSGFTGDIQWQSSTNNFLYLDIPGATTNPYVHVPGDSRYYRAKIVANACQPEYSDSLFVPVSYLQEFSQTTTADFSVNTTTGLDSAGDNVSLIASGNLNLGTGANGAYSATANTTLAGGTYNFTSFNINAGVTVTVTDTTPLIINCTGAATINGTLDLSGKDGGDGVNNGSPGSGGAGGGGGGYKGGNGGDGGTSTSNTYHGANGIGPAHGKGGITEYVSSLDGQGGGGGGHGTSGGNSYHTGGGGGVGGSAFGSNLLTVLTRGSGGGGGAGDDDGTTGDDGGGGGGGGGGAVKLSANSLSIGSGGSIISNGGDGGTCGNGGSGGGGAGGAIYLVSYNITNAGSILAEGGTSNTQQLANSVGGDGGDGRIRMDYISLTNNGTITPTAGYVGPAGTYNASGTMETPAITPGTNLCEWGEVIYNVDTSGTGGTLTVDILNSSGSTVASNVQSGTNLNTLPAVSSLSTIKLKLSIATTVNTYSPILFDWKVQYYIK